MESVSHVFAAFNIDGVQYFLVRLDQGWAIRADDKQLGLYRGEREGRLAFRTLHGRLATAAVNA